MVDRLLGGGCLTSSLPRSLSQRLRADPIGPRLCHDPGSAWRAWWAGHWHALMNSVSSVIKTPAPTPLVDKAA